MNTQIKEPLKTEVRISWPVRLKSLNVNEKLTADIFFTSTVRQAISKLHALTNLRFVTETNGSTLIVTRIDNGLVSF